MAYPRHECMENVLCTSPRRVRDRGDISRWRASFILTTSPRSWASESTPHSVSNDELMAWHSAQERYRGSSLRPGLDGKTLEIGLPNRRPSITCTEVHCQIRKVGIAWQRKSMAAFLFLGQRSMLQSVFCSSMRRKWVVWTDCCCVLYLGEVCCLSVEECRLALVRGIFARQGTALAAMERDR